MTDKEKIIAEIDRRLLKETAFNDGELEHEYKCALKDIKRFINTLPPKPVSEGLEEKINELNKRYPEVSFAKLTRIAVSVDRWEKELSINRACEWLKDNIHKYLYVCDGEAGFPTAEFVKYFKQAMEEKQHDTP